MSDAKKPRVSMVVSVKQEEIGSSPAPIADPYKDELQRQINALKKLMDSCPEAEPSAVELPAVEPPHAVGPALAVEPPAVGPAPAVGPQPATAPPLDQPAAAQRVDQPAAAPPVDQPAAAQHADQPGS